MMKASLVIPASLLLFVTGHIVFIAALLWMQNVNAMLVGVAVTLTGMLLGPLHS
jgi:hypothetical protein